MALGHCFFGYAFENAQLLKYVYDMDLLFKHFKALNENTITRLHLAASETSIGKSEEYIRYKDTTTIPLNVVSRLHILDTL